ncbi:MAG: deoxyribonuclease [Candidatus Paceibacter sp.]|jgi:deoxyribonuclease V|nr:deoxyribonuclease [Candidatus Paceibacter sp.]
MTHPTPKEAIEIQKKMRALVNTEFLQKEIKYIGGADISLNRFAKEIFAGIIVLKYPTLEVVEYATLQSETNFPYIPGLLSFREAPALVEVWQKLKRKPDMLVVDGQGIAHPRRLGIATHIGITLDVPTIGCAKSLLYGVGEEPDLKAGSIAYLYDKYNKEEILGVQLRTKDNIKPVIVSPGHKVSIEQAIEIMKAMTRKYRIPEPTRLAHELVNQFRRGELHS